MQFYLSLCFPTIWILPHISKIYQISLNYGFVDLEYPSHQKKQSVQSPLSKPHILSIIIVGFNLGVKSSDYFSNTFCHWKCTCPGAKLVESQRCSCPRQQSGQQNEYFKWKICISCIQQIFKILRKIAGNSINNCNFHNFCWGVANVVTRLGCQKPSCVTASVAFPSAS